MPSQAMTPFQTRLAPSGLILGAVLIAVCASCASGGDESPDLGPPPDVQQIPEKIHPTLSLTSPMRGTYTSEAEVPVRGTVTSGSAPISKLKIDGMEVPVASDGSFAHPVPLLPGLNIIGIRAEAEDGGRAVDALSMFSGAIYAPDAVIHQGAHLHMGPEFIDDNDPALDDLASILEVMLQDDAFLSSFFGEPYDFNGDTLTVKEVQIVGAAIDITPEQGCLFAHLSLGEQVEGDGGYVHLVFTVDGLTSILGEDIILDATQLTIDTRLCPTMAEELTVEVRDTVVQFEGFLLSTSEYPNLAEELPSTHASLEEFLESYMAEWMTESLGALLADFLTAFAMESTVAMEGVPPITAFLDLEDGGVTSEGIFLTMSVRFSIPKALAITPAGAGSMRTDDPPLAPGFSSQPFALALSDDAINQLLFAFWWGGAIADYELTPESLSELPEVFQPLGSIGVGMQLPSTLMLGQEPEFSYDLVAGGVLLDIVADPDRRFSSTLHIRAGVDIAVTDEGLLSLELDDRAQKITVQANVTEVPQGLDPGDIAALFRMMLPTILGQVTVSFGGFPIPAIQLSTFGENVAAFQGKALTLSPSEISRQGQGSGYLVVEGDVREASN